MTFTAEQARLHQAKMARRLNKSNDVAVDACEKEIGKGGLQQQIADWCDAQWPQWVYDFPRTDLKSTLPNGRHDATIWGPHPKCYLIETKAKGKKRSIDQLAWEAKLRMLNWKVELVYSYEQFLEITK